RSLARHLAGSFGEIRITRLEPETAIAWEGEHVSGMVRLEPSGWGTRVTLTAQTPVEEPAPPVAEESAVGDAEIAEESIAEEAPTEGAAGEEPPDEAEPARPRRRLLQRLRAFFTGPEPAYVSAKPEFDVSAESSTPEAIAEPVAVEPEPE